MPWVVSRYFCITTKETKYLFWKSLATLMWLENWKKISKIIDVVYAINFLLQYFAFFKFTVLLKEFEDECLAFGVKGIKFVLF